MEVTRMYIKKGRGRLASPLLVYDGASNELKRLTRAMPEPVAVATTHIQQVRPDR